MLEALPTLPPQKSSVDSSSGLNALLTRAACAPIDDLGWIRITGEDRVRWLNGMATNSIQALTQGQGCYNFFLNAQGRIQADATAFVLEESILLETASARIPAVVAMLDHFIIMDDVELTAVEASAGLLVAGPKAPALLDALHLAASGLDELHLVHTTFNGAPVDLIHAYSPLVPRFELWSSPETIATITQGLGPEIPQASPQDLEQLRILEGTPLFGTDIRDRDLPQETAQHRALHFSKGCYLGQEIVERIRSRGNVHRTFSGFQLSGPAPSPGTSLFKADAPEKPIGELTSAAEINLPSGPVVLALGYIRREALEASRSSGYDIRYSGGDAQPISLRAAISAKI